MRAVVQRVSRAKVTVGDEVTGEIGRGLLVLLGVTHKDEAKDAEYLADKIVTLRIFDDAFGKMNLSLSDVAGEMLVVSQFTLYGDTRRGRHLLTRRAAKMPCVGTSILWKRPGKPSKSLQRAGLAK